MPIFINKRNFCKIVIITWIFLWLSIGAKPANFNFNSYIDTINILRIYLPIFFSIIIFFISIIIIKFSNLEIKNKKKYFSFVNLFLIYFFFQIVGLYQNNLTTFNLDNLYLIVFGFGAMQIFIINQLFDNNNNNNVKYLLYASLMICFIASNVNFFFFIKYTNYDLFIDFFNKKDFRNFYDSILGVKFFLNENIPRSTGISRTFGLINIAIIIYLLFVIKKKTVKYLFYSISFIYTSLIWLLQSRGSILIFFITIAVIIFILKKINIKKKIYLFFFLFLLPIFSVEMIFFSFKLNIYNSSYIKKFIDRQDSKPIRITTDFSSSGRLTIWEESLKNFDKNKIFGYGPQGDRFLLTGLNNLDKYSNNASNALIYSLLSGGYFAITIFLLIYFNILNKIYIFFKKIKILEKKKDVNINLSISYVIFFFLRSFFENSFSLFGIDFLIFICSAVYIENYLKENKALF